jgi:uncharacterized membrane protein
VTVITAAERRPVHQHLLRVALALSLVLNLCFIGGAVWIRMHAPPRHPGIARRFHQIESRLALDHYAASVEGSLRRMHRRIAPLIGEAWTAMAKPQTKAADVMPIFDQVRAARRGFEQDLTTDTLAFLARLSPVQRQKFVALVYRHPARRHPAH